MMSAYKPFCIIILEIDFVIKILQSKKKNYLLLFNVYLC